MRSLSLNVVGPSPRSPDNPQETIFDHISRHGSSWLPPRLASFDTVPLDSLTITYPFFNGLAVTYWLAFLPHFNPKHVHFWSNETEALSRVGFACHQGISRCEFLLEWTRLEEVTFLGWLPWKLPTVYSTADVFNGQPRQRHPRPSDFFLDEWPHRRPYDGRLVLHIQEKLLCEETDAGPTNSYTPQFEKNRGRQILRYWGGVDKGAVKVYVASLADGKGAQSEDPDEEGSWINGDWEGVKPRSDLEEARWRKKKEKNLRQDWLDHDFTPEQANNIDIIFR